MVIKRTTAAAAVLLAVIVTATTTADAQIPGLKYQALVCPAPSLGSTWAVLQRDGANRPVEAYLSSLGQGESGVGTITSPPFVIADDTITFTICGHDGQAGGRGENFIALVDARKGKTLLKTPPPGNDAPQEETWDVAKFQGMEVRVEVHDGNNGGAYAWLGIGSIKTGEALSVDFGEGIPEVWQRPERTADVEYEVLSGSIPFRRNTTVYSLIPSGGSVEIPCGFSAQRLYLLGCTVAGGATPGETYGGVEIHYRTRSPDVFPLMVGFTLDGQHKQLSRSPAMFLQPTGDPFQHCLAISPRDGMIERIRLVAGPEGIPQITAVTCQTSAQSDRLVPLPADDGPTVEQAAQLAARAIATASPRLEPVVATIRWSRKIGPLIPPIRFRKHQLDAAFRSEGVAVADFNGDGRPDVAAGNVYYAGPDWKMIPMRGRPQEFNRFGYSDAFLCFDEDVNRDGATDLIVVGFPGQQTHWLENPGKSGGVWPKHVAVERTGNESPTYVDVDGDGRRELLFMDRGQCVTARPGQDPSKPWPIRAISAPGDPAPGHGLGVGDVNGDGRADVLVPTGWWEGPNVRNSAEKTPKPWTFHPAEFYGGVQLCVEDLDSDGDNDVLGASAHG